MIVDAEFTIKVKISDMIVNHNTSGHELKLKVKEEGEKKLRYYLSGYLQDPNNQIISNEVSYKIKED